MYINQEISIWRCKYNRLEQKHLPSEIKNFNWIQIIEGKLLIRDKNNKPNKLLNSGDGVGFEISGFSDVEIESETEVDLLLFSMPNI